ncbi:aspartyl-phosphate phosphatase Spo0E family protein [Clostridium sporogenes]|uniref:aspartyl-phosphate phosphatase Spo0E family protein n=1 Tax=Clostridium sporogenes TaxID=1509 RepID=UPI0013D1FD1F|nr:aspartyl-phosphate phosphatase Spo0E family protein [Clostridium sporogenes]NFQ84152.1 aspartyl-phosphate phosphatase Spo0E family protein [Clostridium sporogenes]
MEDVRQALYECIEKYGLNDIRTIKKSKELEELILKKYEPCCIFCGEAKEVIKFKGKNICRICLKELGK